MKRYLHILLALTTAILTATVFTGCTDDVDADPVIISETDCINLKIGVPVNGNGRSATDPLNEFTVRSLHLYFYASAGHNDATSEYLFDYTVSDVFEVQRSLSISLPANALRDGGLFGSTGTDCIVYAVANVDEAKLTAKTIDGLKATVVDSEFDKTKIQDAFAMDGRATLTLNRENRSASGHIELQRAAAKITLSIDIPTTIDVTETVSNQDGTSQEITYKYTPRTADMHVWMANGVKTSPLNIAPTPTAETNLYSNEITTTEGSAFEYNAAMEKYKYVQDVPFYSYPNQWEQYDLNGNSHLTLEIPWTYEDQDHNTHNVVTYYRLNIQPEKCFVERNMHYDMRVTINRLGSVSKQTPTDILVDWAYVLPWNDQQLVTDIKDIRYLLLNNNDYDTTIGAYAYKMENATDIEIPISTSHNVMVAEVTMSWIDYSINPPKSRKITLTSDGAYKYSDLSGYNESTKKSVFAGIEIDNSNSKLYLKRDLLHIIGSDSDPVWVEGHYEWRYNRDTGRHEQVWVEGWQGGSSIAESEALNTYTFDIKLRHIDDASQTANVRITQIPAIYITALETKSENTRFVNYNNKKTSVNGVNKGCVDNYRAGDDYNLGSLGEKSNHNTYVLTITRFDASELKDYIIADPRTRDVDNLPVSGSKIDDASWSVSDGNNLLRYYYPADGEEDKTRYIAPKLRVASQWGVTTTITRDGAQRRCASYQENGRPAGRWRLPTVAEIEFIATLSCNNYIPYLFGDKGGSADYWCASGAIKVTNSDRPTVESTTGNTHFARCVYDEWYWGTDTLTQANKNKFTWGDKLRTHSGNNP